MAVTDYRGVTITSGSANDYLSEIVLSTDDEQGRILRFELWNGGTAVTSTTGLSARFYIDVNGNPMWQDLSPVSGTATATWSAALMMGGITAGKHRAEIRVTDTDGGIVATRPFVANVQRGVIDGADSETMTNAEDLLAEVETINLTLASDGTLTLVGRDGTVTTSTAAKTAATSANTAASAANTAATAANTAASAANDAAARAETAARPTEEMLAPYMKRPIALVKDATTQLYNLDAWFSSRVDAKIYTVYIPNANAGNVGTECIAGDDRVGLNCTPTIGSVIGDDDFVRELAFTAIDCDLTIADDGTYSCHGVSIDNSLDYENPVGDVFVARPVLYFRYVSNCDEMDGYDKLSISLMAHEGFKPCPGAIDYAGNLRPYIAHAKYTGSKDNDGLMRSVSGAPVWNYNMSYSGYTSVITNKGNGYGGRSIADDWYLRVMMLVKYLKKSSQEVFTGCTSYNVQHAVGIAESNVRRVVLPNATANQLVVGSCIMCGTHPSGTNTDRNTAANHDIFDKARITSTEPYDDGSTYTIVNVDVDDAFNVPATAYVSTAPWQTGSTDSIPTHDGTAANDSRHPFKIQGIETAVGVYEANGDVVASVTKDADTGVVETIPYVVYDQQNRANSLTADFVSMGVDVSEGLTASAYRGDIAEAGGGLWGVPAPSMSSTKGLGDNFYISGSSGLREWLVLGDLGYGATAGLWYVNSYNSLGGGYWSIAGRLSGTARSRG